MGLKHAALYLSLTFIVSSIANNKVLGPMASLPMTNDVLQFGEGLLDNLFGDGLFEGDIVLDSQQKERIHDLTSGNGSINGAPKGSHRNAIKDVFKKWPGGVVPYVITWGHFWPNDERVIYQAIEDYRRKTCIRFIKRTNQRDYIRIFRGNGCYSMVGREGNVQDMSLGDGCVHKGTIIHEMMHAIGFFHEQSRADRDNYIWIDRNNIERGQEHNFKKYDLNKISHLGARYDQCSIMHYGVKDFSKNGRPTIIPRVSGHCNIGQRQEFSDTDVRKINTLYQCRGYPQVQGGHTTGGRPHTGGGGRPFREGDSTTTGQCSYANKDQRKDCSGGNFFTMEKNCLDKGCCWQKNGFLQFHAQCFYKT